MAKGRRIDEGSRAVHLDRHPTPVISLSDLKELLGISEGLEDSASRLYRPLDSKILGHVWRPGRHLPQQAASTSQEPELTIIDQTVQIS
jgi:hypothetical protein